MKQTVLRIALTGGGSGGHIYPLVAVAEALEKLMAEKKIYGEIRYFGPVDNYRNVLEGVGVQITPILSGKIRRYFSLSNILDIPKVVLGSVQAFFKLFWFMPDVLFSKGGAGAFPTVLAARFYRIPVIIHESDAQPGLNNLLSAPFANRIAVSFERALHYFNPRKTAWVGNPIRSSLLGERFPQERAKEELGFNAAEPLVVILGGSQGAQRINELVILVLKDLIQITQVLHQTGTANFSEIQKLSRTVLLDVPIKTEIKNRYQAVPYLEDDFKAAFTAADLVVARAGSSIFEISAFSKPSILIPLSGSANDHQRRNAYEFARTGAAIIIEEINLLPGIFLHEIGDTLKNQELLNTMSLASGKFFKPQAAEILAEEILRMTGA